MINHGTLAGRADDGIHAAAAKALELIADGADEVVPNLDLVKG